jgi:hypothetical protein
LGAHRKYHEISEDYYGIAPHVGTVASPLLVHRSKGNEKIQNKE